MNRAASAILKALVLRYIYEGDAPDVDIVLDGFEVEQCDYIDSPIVMDMCLNEVPDACSVTFDDVELALHHLTVSGFISLLNGVEFWTDTVNPPVLYFVIQPSEFQPEALLAAA
jgi:hypothetical protein